MGREILGQKAHDLVAVERGEVFLGEDCELAVDAVASWLALLQVQIGTAQVLNPTQEIMEPGAWPNLFHSPF
jgi:hypothetical protein